jgi:phage protein D
VPETNAVPDIAVLIDGTELSSAAYADLLDVEVQDDTEALSACTLSLAAWDDEQVALAYVDDATFAVGGELEVKLGYTDALESVFKGEITGLELELTSAQTPRFVVRGYDLRHRLLRGSRMRTFTNMKDSDIAAQVARENGLTADVTDSTVTHEYVLQDGKSDLDFLRARAAQIGFEVVVSGKKLSFRPVDEGGRAAVVLATDADLTEASLRLTAREQVGAVEVRGWDPSGKQAIVGKAAAGQETSMGTSGGPKSGDDAFGKATLSLVDHALAQQDAADRVALSVLEKLALGYVRAECSGPGRADLHAGLVVEIQGAGQRFSGTYYLTSVAHRFSTRDGFSTSFSGRRNAT